MKKESTKAWAARQVLAVCVRAVRAAETEAQVNVRLANEELAKTLRTAAEVRQRLGIK